jgi:hypothetical protein
VEILKNKELIIDQVAYLDAPAKELDNLLSVALKQ